MFDEKSLEKASFFKMVEEAPGMILYFSNDSCGPCQSLRIKIKELVGSDFPKMNFREIKAAASPVVAAHYGVFSAPTILVFFEGREVIRENQFVALYQLQERLARYYHLVFEEKE